MTPPSIQQATGRLNNGKIQAFSDGIHGQPQWITVPITATAIDKDIFTANVFRAQVLGISYCPNVAGTDTAAVTLMVEKCTGTTAIGSGTDQMTATLNLKGTVKTVQNGTLSATLTDNVLAIGDRLALDVTGDLTAVEGVLTLCIAPLHG